MITFPRVAAGEDVVISATTYASYVRCAEQAAGRMRGEYGPDSKASFRGGLAHRIFARHLGRGPIDAGDFEQACREEIGSGLNPKIGALQLRPSELKGVIQEVGELYARFKAFPTEGFLAAEVKLEATPTEGVLLRGSIDALFSDPEWGTRLIDWKTGSIEGAGPQLDFYCLLWALERGELPGRAEVISVKTGERTGQAPTVEQVQATAGAVAAMVGALRTTFLDGVALERTAGPWCRYCALLEECEEGQAAHRVAVGARPSVERSTS